MLNHRGVGRSSIFRGWRERSAVGDKLFGIAGNRGSDDLAATKDQIFQVGEIAVDIKKALRSGIGHLA
jgi:hypothetical protein